MTKAWRMERPCVDCPFSTSDAGKRQWRALRPEFRRQLRQELLGKGGREPTYFLCHKTTEHDDEGEHVASAPGQRVCAGAIAFQDQHHVSSNYARVCERLDEMRAAREAKR
jgi:hypothetical protein